MSGTLADAGLTPATSTIFIAMGRYKKKHSVASHSLLRNIRAERNAIPTSIQSIYNITDNAF